MKPFYIYTNINDLAVYTGHDAIVPGYALNKESFFGSFCSLNKYGIIVTDKILSKHFIEKTCAHKNIVPVVIETILPFDDTALVFIIDKDYRMRQDVLSNYCDSDLAVFVREYLPA